MRTKRSGLAFPSYERPQVFDRESLPVWRRYTKLHTQLYPYLRGADASYRASGMPIMRHALLTHPGDRGRCGRTGSSCSAPTCSPRRSPPRARGGGASTRRRGGGSTGCARFAIGRRDGAFLPARDRAAARRRAPTRLPAHEHELPLLVRAGAVLPMLPGATSTRSPPTAEVRWCGSSERADRLTLLAFPRGRWHGRLGGRGRMSAREGRRCWTLRPASRARAHLHAARRARFARRPFRPRRVTVNGRPLRRAAWRYDPRGRVLTASFRTGPRATV